MDGGAHDELASMVDDRRRTRLSSGTVATEVICAQEDSSRGVRSSTQASYGYSAATARGSALTTEALPEVISSWIHL
jgi:hypothetical protein